MFVGTILRVRGHGTLCPLTRSFVTKWDHPAHSLSPAHACMHRNPVTRGLVASAERWRWSSFRTYAFGEKGIVAVNATYTPKWTGRAEA